MAPVALGHTVSVPAPGSEGARALVTVEWKQDVFTSKHEQYYILEGLDRTTGEEHLPVFVQKEWFDDEKNNHCITRFALFSGENIDFVIDNRFQYGQKNRNGDGRFVVYHDKTRNPYQHRFVKSALTLVGAHAVTWLQKYPDWSDLVGRSLDQLKHVLGDSLHTF